MLIFFFFIIDLNFLTPVVITQTFYPIEELVILVDLPAKEAKRVMKTHPLVVEIKIIDRSTQFKIQTF